jgi:hypothetical protein
MHDMFHLIHLIRLRSSLCRRCGRGRMARHASVGADRSVGGGGQRVRYHSDEYRLRLHIATEVRDHDTVQEGGGGVTARARAMMRTMMMMPPCVSRAARCRRAHAPCNAAARSPASRSLWLADRLACWRGGDRPGFPALPVGADAASPAGSEDVPRSVVCPPALPPVPAGVSPKDWSQHAVPSAWLAVICHADIWRWCIHARMLPFCEQAFQGPARVRAAWFAGGVVQRSTWPARLPLPTEAPCPPFTGHGASIKSAEP